MTGSNGKIHVKTRSMRLCTHDRGDFASIRKENVLIYWPHGFGDLVGLGYVLPLLEPSNRYWITRFGDDYLSVMDGSEYVTPVFVGGPPAVLAGDGDSFATVTWDWFITTSMAANAAYPCPSRFMRPAARTTSQLCYGRVIRKPGATGLTLPFQSAQPGSPHRSTRQRSCD